MTVAELVAHLLDYPQDAPVSVNDERSGIFHEDVEDLFLCHADPEHDERECVVLIVNPNGY